MSATKAILFHIIECVMNGFCIAFCKGFNTFLILTCHLDPTRGCALVTPGKGPSQLLWHVCREIIMMFKIF